MSRAKRAPRLPALALVALVAAGLSAQPQDPLASGFRQPPAGARPYTWWHWLDGNITAAGITLDLEAMKRAGIGGTQMFTLTHWIPPGPVRYMSGRWRELTLHASREAARLGLDLGIQNSAGWSSSGGPWIAPENAMQVIAWSEKKVQGPGRFDGVLPPAVPPHRYTSVDYYRDIAVFAFRTPAGGERTVPRSALMRKTAVFRRERQEPETSPAAAEAIPLRRFVNLTGSLRRGGRLTWEIPAGNWTILRIGHVPTGKYNHFAPPEGEGLEVDKLSREALDVHWAATMKNVIADAGPLAGKTLSNVLIDSYEVGSQNWTRNFPGEFRARRGYDCVPWLPAMTGLRVESKEMSERFLWDVRRTVADLYADNYYGHFADLCHKAGMKLSTQVYGNGGFDDIQSGAAADIPMGEFGATGANLYSTKLASSIGHVYGKRVIAAESFTSNEVEGRWRLDPWSVKAMGDLAFCNGINRIVIHRYAHQPWPALAPGMTMGPWGMHFERTLTWWKEASAWLSYLARCQYLLQQGRPVSDILFFYGESAPVGLPERSKLAPRIPEGYDYDGCDSRVVLIRLSVDHGRLVLPDGTSYRVLVLPESRFLSLPLARKVRELVAAGATVVGPKPQQSPSLTGYPECDREVRAIAEEVWGGVDGRTVTRRTFGSGTIVWGEPLERVLTDAGVPPDVRVTGISSDAKIATVHRTIGNSEVYFVSNQRYEAAEVEVAFRVSGRIPELWHPDSGRSELAPLFREENGGTVIPMNLAPAESLFVVFRRPAPKVHWSHVRLAGQDSELPALSGRARAEGNGSRAQYDLSAGADGSLVLSPWVSGTFEATSSTGRQKAASVNVQAPVVLAGPWAVRFPPNLGAPRSITLPRLRSWTEHPVPGVKYFSGTATYEQAFEFPPDVPVAGRPPRLVMLDLGRVRNFARVRLNGRELPVLWKEPFEVDVTSAVKAGTNRLEIEVTNLWPNRLIGDERLAPDVDWEGTQLKKWPDWLLDGSRRPRTGRVAFTTWRFYARDSALLESGLLGPVVIRTMTPVNLGPPP